MAALPLPDAVHAVFENFLCCEFSTLSKDGTPIAWPLASIYWPERGKFLFASPVALSQKVVNIRRSPQVCLLYSELTGSGMANPLRVLVQGLAEVPEPLIIGAKYPDREVTEAVYEAALKMTRRQPALKLYLSNGLTRRLMYWYFIRHLMIVTPLRIRWWENADTSTAPQELEVRHVG